MRFGKPLLIMSIYPYENKTTSVSDLIAQGWPWCSSCTLISTQAHIIFRIFCTKAARCFKALRFKATFNIYDLPLIGTSFNIPTEWLRLNNLNESALSGNGGDIFSPRENRRRTLTAPINPSGQKEKYLQPPKRRPCRTTYLYD